jgi:fatty-acyl-CoA synthase
MPDNSAPWVDGLTIGQMLRETARRHGDRDALVFPQFGYRATYRQFDAEVDRVARALLAMGIERGEHIALWATNWPQWVLLQFASARVGVVLVNINPAYRSHELGYVLKQSDSVALFLIDKFKSSDYFAMVGEAIPELSVAGSRREPTAAVGESGLPASVGEVSSREFPKLRRIVTLTEAAPAGMLNWSGFLKLADGECGMAALGRPVNSTPTDQTPDGRERPSYDELAERESQIRPDDAVNIQYTSGTTGFPKGATLTHRNLLLNAFYIGDCQRLTEQDRICIPVPFYHCFGCVLGTLGAAVRGAAMVIPFEYFEPAKTLDAIEAERATSLYGVPTMFISQLDHPTKPARERNLKSLRTGIMAGSPCPIEIMQRVGDEMGCREVTIAYGLTEASPVITQTRTDDPIELRVATVGRPIPDIEVKVIDPANGATLGDNQQGELCTRGHVVMLGYYNMPEQTAAAIDSDGWLHSGDLAVRLPNGYYKITGRIKDMVIRGGENIYPREIEEFLFTHPVIENVAVVGVPDPKYIEELAAWIKLKPGATATATEDEIRSFCKGHLAHYKVPKYIRFVTEYPQTVTGKIQKFKIREAMIAELNLDQTAKREMA